MNEEEAKRIIEEERRKKIEKGARIRRLIDHDRKYGSDFLGNEVRASINRPSPIDETQKLLMQKAKEVIRNSRKSEDFER